MPNGTCDLCLASDSVEPCAWPVDHAEPVAIAELKRGDRFAPFDGAKRGGIVQRVTPRPKDGEVEIVTDVMSYFVEPWKPVLRIVSGTCGLLACARCAREVAEGRVYCRDHWNAWEKVA